MRAWWLLSVASVALMLAALVLVGPMPPALRAALAALVYEVVRRW